MSCRVRKIQFARFLPVFLPCVAAIIACLGSPATLRGQSPQVRQFEAYRHAGKYREAEDFARQTLRYWESRGHERNVASWLHNLSLAVESQGRYKEVEPLLKRAMEITRRYYGDNHPKMANSMNSLAELYRLQARYAEAEPLYKRALRIFESNYGRVHAHVAMVVNNMAILYASLGRYDEVEPLYKRALAIDEQLTGRNSAQAALDLSNLADFYRQVGRHQEAEPLLRRSLAIRERTLGSNHHYVADTLLNLAILYNEQGRYSDAEPLYKRSLSISQRALGREHPFTANTLNGLAEVYREQGRNEEAEPIYQRALAAFEKSLGPNHSKVAMVLNNMAIIAGRKGEHSKEEQLLKRALAIDEKLLGSAHPNLTNALTNLAALYMDDLERYDESEKLNKRVIAIREAAYGRDHPQVTTGLHNLAALYQKQERFDESRALIDRTVGILEGHHLDPQLLYSCYIISSQLDWKSEKQDAAIAHLQQAMEIAEELRTSASGGEHEQAALFGRLAAAYELALKWNTQLGDVAAAHAAVERGRSRALLDQLEVRGADLLSGLPANQARGFRKRDADSKLRVATLERKLRALSADASILAAQKQQRANSLQADLAEARKAVVVVYRDIRNASPAFRLTVGRDFKPRPLDTLQTWVTEQDALLLQYVLGVENSYLFVIPATGKSRVVQLAVSKDQAERLKVEAGPLTSARLSEVLQVEGKQLLELLTDPDRTDEALPRLAELYTLLIPPAERQLLLDGKIKRLIVLPDGPLSTIPFETLVVEQSPGEEPKYLLDVGPPVVYGPSATFLHNLAIRPIAPPDPDTKPVLTVGDPAYASASTTSAARSALSELSARSRYGTLGGSLSRLPYSGMESAWVADVFRKRGILVGQLRGSEATEARIRYNVEGRRIVHLACHGLADQKYGNFFGALALTPGARAATNPLDDGFLTLAEIYGLDMTGCELAILSACDTNFGPQQRGEGVWALSRGFLVAGARRVVASNWLVDDKAAASLVSYFCGGVAVAEEKKEAADHAAALHAAKRWVRQQEKWKSPYYWGTFVLIGPN